MQSLARGLSGIGDVNRHFAALKVRADDDRGDYRAVTEPRRTGAWGCTSRRYTAAIQYRRSTGDLEKTICQTS